MAKKIKVKKIMKKEAKVEEKEKDDFFSRDYKPSPYVKERQELELEIGRAFKDLLIEFKLFLRRASKRTL